MYSGSVIRKLRLLKGFNQKGIAKKLGITQQAYSKLEKADRVSSEKFSKVVETLQCSANDLQIATTLFNHP